MGVAVTRARQRCSRASSAKSRSGTVATGCWGALTCPILPHSYGGGVRARPVLCAARAAVVRAGLLAAVVALLLPAVAAPAFAHAGGLTSAPSEARVLAVEPPVPGLDVQAVEFGARLRLVHRPAVSVVLGPGPRSALSGLPAAAPPERAWWAGPRGSAAPAR